MIRRTLYHLTILFCLITSGSLYAKPVTIDYAAVIEYINDPDFSFQGSLNVGDTITGTYTYDSDLKDQDSSGGTANYYFPQPIPQELGFTLNLPLGLDFYKSVSTDLYIYMEDSYTERFNAISCCQVATLGNGAVINHMLMDLFNSDGTAFINASLGGVQNLAAFQQRMLLIDGVTASGLNFNIQTRIIDIHTPPDACSLCSFPPAPDHQAYTAIVRDVYDPSNTMSSYFQVGRKISGMSRFNPLQEDSDLSAEYAFYSYPPGDPAVGMTLSLASGTYSSNPAIGNLFIHVMNYPEFSGMDLMDIVSTNADIRLPNGAVVSDVITSLRNPNGDTLLTTLLAESLNESLFAWQEREVMIHGMAPDGSYFQVIADIVSLEQEDVSVSTQLTVAPDSGSVVMGQNFDAGIILKADMPPVLEATLSLLPRFGPPLPPVYCYPGTISSDGRQTVFCPNVSGQLQPGINLFQVDIKFIDGTSRQKTGYWEAVGY